VDRDVVPDERGRGKHCSWITGHSDFGVSQPYDARSVPSEKRRQSALDDLGTEQLGDWVRRRWHIENRLHWVRDVTLGGDAHRPHTGNGSVVAAVLRNIAIGYHHSNGETNIACATGRADRRPNDLIDAVISTTRTQ
jgi:hypothetical protein